MQNDSDSKTMNVNIPDIMDEFSATTEKLIKGYETLKEIDSVQVATTPKTLVWECDKVKLYRYDREKPATCKVPVLVSFALLNRHDVLDLQPDRSLMKNLIDQGLDVYIMDWGYPTKQDRYLTMEDYIEGYMNDAVDIVREESGEEKIHKMGICQGGTFSLIYSALHPEKIQSLTCLVTPVDFSTNDSILFKWTKDINVDSMVDSTDGLISADMLNQAFGMLKPTMPISKYHGIMGGLENKVKILNFLRMEHWKTDCPDISGEVYRQWLKDLFQENKLIKGEFMLGNQKVDLKKVTMPVMNIYATEDNIVPPKSTMALNEHIGSKDNELYKFQGGHIGVFVGGRSQKELAPAMAEWITTRS